MKKLSATAIVLAPTDFKDLRHTLNSLIRSVQYASKKYEVNILIYDEYGIYSNPYLLDNQKLPVTKKLEHLSNPLTLIIPKNTLVTKEWVAGSLDYLSKNSSGLIVRPEFHIKWGPNRGVDIISQASKTDALFSIEEPFYSGLVAVKTAAYSEVLHTITGLAEAEILNAGSCWLHMDSYILPATAVFTMLNALSGNAYLSAPQYKLSSVRAAIIPTREPEQELQAKNKRKEVYKTITRRVLVSGLRRTRLLPVAKRVVTKTRRTNQQITELPSSLPSWLINEWRALHRIENRIFPSGYLISNAPITDMPNYRSFSLGYTYSKIAKASRHDHYDYIFFIPWLVRGGADKFTIEYANQIKRIRPDFNILVLSTLEGESVWADKLDPEIDFCNFEELSRSLDLESKFRLLELLVIQSKPKIVHIINSELAYKFVELRSKILKELGVRIVATSFSQEVLPTGKVIGYSHVNVPRVYDSIRLITSDNQAVIEMWHHDYGFEKERMAVHHLPYEITKRKEMNRSHNKPFKVLWASRLNYEKLPNIINDIGRELLDNEIIIHMYGTASRYFDTSFLQKAPSNVVYMGPFDGINTIPLSDYDAFLYTSLFDGMPNTLLEVGSVGLPIVASHVGGIPELIEQDKTGMLVKNIYSPKDYANALIFLKDNPDKSREMSSKLLERISREYNPNQFKNSVSAMLQELGL